MSGVIQRDRVGIIDTVLHWDEHTEELHVERTQDVEPLLDRNKAIQAQRWDGYNDARDMQAIAELPIAILEQWHKEGVSILDPNHDKEIRKRLRDPALSGFRLDTPVAHSGIIILGAK